MELVKLRDLLELLRASGVTTYKDGDLELELGAAPADRSAGKEILRTAVATQVEKDLKKLPEGYGEMFTATASGDIQ